MTMRRTKAISGSYKRMRVDTDVPLIDNKSCQGAKVITTWSRTIVQEVTSFPVSPCGKAVSKANSIELTAVTEMSFRERLERAVSTRETKWRTAEGKRSIGGKEWREERAER